MSEIRFTRIDHKGRLYSNFFVSKSPQDGPGWYIFGRHGGENKGEGIIHLCGRPAVWPRKHPHYNSPIMRGWKTKKEAQAIADQLNKE